MDVELVFFFPECGVWDGICLWLSSVAEERDHCRQPHQIPVLHGRLLVPHHPQLHRIRGQSFHIRKKKKKDPIFFGKPVTSESRK